MKKMEEIVDGKNKMLIMKMFISEWNVLKVNRADKV